MLTSKAMIGAEVVAPLPVKGHYRLADSPATPQLDPELWAYPHGSATGHRNPSLGVFWRLTNVRN